MMRRDKRSASRRRQSLFSFWARKDRRSRKSRLASNSAIQVERLEARTLLTSTSTEFVENSALLGVQGGELGLSDAQAAFPQASFEALGDYGLYEATWQQSDNISVDNAIAALETSSFVEFAEPNYIVQPSVIPNDPRFSELWGMNNTGQTGGTADADIDAVEGWDISTGSDSILVAVIDTGVDWDHEDLAANIWTNPNEIPNNGVDDDSNGYIDDVRGWDFVDDDNDPDEGGGTFHGTHVAGTVGAVGNNGIGVTGGAWNVTIMPVRFLGPSGGTTADAILSVNYSVDNGAIISNNSWGGGGFSNALRSAIDSGRQNDQIFAAAAGNSNVDNDASPFYPSSYDLDNIVSVAASDDNDAPAGFTQWGATSVDIAAPGVAILSTMPNDTYGLLDGTSMATPLTSGALAVIRSKAPNANYQEIIQYLYDGADPLTPAWSSKPISTSSRVNLSGSLRLIQPDFSLTADTTTSVENETIPVQLKIARSGTPAELAVPLTVYLASNDESEFTVPESVVIESNQTEAEFFGEIQDDAILDGSQVATISASIDNPAFVSDPLADPLLVIATLDITIQDYEVLSVEIVDSSGDPVTSLREDAGEDAARAIITRSNTSVTTAPNFLVSQSNRVLEYTSAGQLIDEFDVEFGGVSRQASASHRLFAVASLNGADTILEFNPETGAELNRFAAPNASGMAFTGKRLFYLVRTNANRLVEADPNTGKVIKNHQIPSGALHDGVAHLNGKLYLLNSLNTEISVFDPKTGQILNTMDLAAINNGFPTLSGDITGITGPDGLILTTASTSELIELDPSTGAIRTRGTHSERNRVLGSAAVGGNIYLGTASSSSIGVYDRTGTFLRRKTLPLPAGVRSLGGDNTGPATEKARDLVVLADGSIAIYDGTFEVYAESRDTAGNFGTPVTLAGLSTQDIAGYGGIAWSGSTLYLTDMVTGSTDRTKGIVQVTGGTAERFDSAFNFTDLSLSVNSTGEPRLFALTSGTQTVVVFDPADLTTPIGSIALDHAVRSIAVNSEGQIYGGGLDGVLYSFDETGAETGSLSSGAGLLIDLDFASDREAGPGVSPSETNAYLVAGTANGQVLITDESLGSFTAFRVGDGQSPVYVSLASAVAFGSEPETLPELVVDLMGDDTEIVLPRQVIIPAGQASVTVNIDAQDDLQLDGTQIVEIAPSASGYEIATAELRVTDQEELTFTIEQTSLAEGGKTIATISRSNLEGPFDFRDSHSVVADDLRLPIAIRDNETIQSVFNVSGVPSAEILDLNVTVNLTHTWAADLELTLISPDIVALDGSVSNRRVTLISDNGTNGSNLTGTVFDDEGLKSVVTGNAPFTGRFRPQGKLSDFDGLKPNGTWTLEVTDDNIQNQGRLLGWSLDFLVNGLRPLTVSITSNDDPNSQELILPASVVLLANQQSVSFEIEAINDFRLDSIQVVEVTASAPEYVDDTGAVLAAVNEVQVLDADAPEVTAPIGDVAPNNVVARWNAVEPEDIGSTVTYNVQVQLVSTGADVHTETGVTGTEFDLSEILEQDSYRVRVGAVVGSDAPSWSEFVSFANSIAPTAPTVFTNAQAIGDRIAQTSDRTPTVFWNKTGDAVRYLVTVNTIHGVPDETLPQAERDVLVDGDGEKDEVATFTVDSTVLGSIDPQNPQFELLELSELELGSYRVKVASQDSLHRWSPDSSYFYFDIIGDVPQPLRPIVVSPDSIITDDTPVVRWEMPGRADGGDPLEGIDHFTVAIVKGDRSRTVFYERTVRRTSLLIQNVVSDGAGGQIIQGLPVNENYKVFVNAYNSEGEHRWSFAHDFKVVTGIPTPSAPIIAKPDTFEQLSNVVTVTWSAVENGLTYDIWANNRTTDERQVIRAFNFRETSYTSDPLPPGVYAVYVRAFNATLQAGPWSAPKFFSVAANLELESDPQVEDSPEVIVTPTTQERVEVPEILMASMQGEPTDVGLNVTSTEVIENAVEATAAEFVDTALDTSFDQVMRDLSESDWLSADAPIEDTAVIESEDANPQAAGLGLIAMVPLVGTRISRVINRFRRRATRRV